MSYRMNHRTLNQAMKSGSMVVMTPEQVKELMHSGSGSGGSYRGGRGRGRGYPPRGRGRGGYSPRDGRRERTDSYDGGRYSYRDDHHPRSGGDTRTHGHQNRYDPYRPSRSHQRSYSDSRGHERNYRPDNRDRDHGGHHYRSHSGRDDHPPRSADRLRSPRHEDMKSHVVKKEEPRDDFQMRPRGRGRGRFMRGRDMRGRGGMVNKFDRYSYRAEIRPRGGPMMGGRGFRRGGMMRGRGTMRRTFNAYYYCRMCERRYYGNREIHKNSREHKEAVRKSVSEIESGRKDGEKDLLQDFEVMDEVGDSDEEGKEKREEKTGGKEENLEDGEIKDKGKKGSESRAALSQDIQPDISNDPLGLRYIISVSGYFCKLCSKFYHDEKTATTSHVKTPQHLERVLKAAKEQYTRNYIEKKRSDKTETTEVKVKQEPETPDKNNDNSKSESESPEKDAEEEDPARKAGRAAASAKIAAVTAKFSQPAPRKSTPRRAAARKPLSLRHKAARGAKKQDAADVSAGDVVDDVVDDVVIEAPGREKVSVEEEEGEILEQEQEERLEIDDNTLDSAAPQEIPGLDISDE